MKHSQFTDVPMTEQLQGIFVVRSVGKFWGYPMRRYRLYTEDKDRGYIEHLFNVTFDSFTVYKTVGFWKGSKEKSLVFEVIEEGGGLYPLKHIAKEIKEHNKQQAVLITYETIQGELI